MHVQTRIVAIVLITMTLPVVALAESTALPEVTLTDLDGKEVTLRSFNQNRMLVIAYTGVGCPIAGRFAPRLEKLSQDFQKKGAIFVGINANPQDDLEKISKDIKELGITFPVLKDKDQMLTKILDAKTTTEVFVVDTDWQIRYRGMVDDQYAIGEQREKPKKRYLKRAIQAVLRGKAPEVTRTAAPGCLITRVTNSTPQEITYHKDIAPIMQESCQKCHRPGQIAPFPLTSYNQVRGWSAMIYSVLEEQRMPPWNADTAFDGLFKNERRLSDQDKELVMNWIRSGMPEGNAADAPAPQEWPKNWRIGEPDKVYKVRKAYKVPKEGVVPYQYFRIPTKFKKDKWIKAIEARPGAAEVVHHILVFIIDPKNPPSSTSQLGLDDGYLCAMVPGDTPSIFPPGAAKKLPAGSQIVLQVHYTTNGKAKSDKCSVGIIFADDNEAIEKEVVTRGIYDLRFVIPPGADNHEVRAEHTLKKDIKLISLFPHMHFRGKDFTYLAHMPSGDTKTLLSVPKYDYNWQESYILNELMSLPAGTRIECIAHFDNSANNFDNPDPTVEVRFGEQTWEEMMIGYVEYIE